MDSKRGFTLLEIVAAVSLLVLISSLAIPNYQKLAQKQKFKLDVATAMQINELTKTYIFEKNLQEESIDSAEIFSEIVKEYFDNEIPKSKYLNKDFSIQIDNNKVTVSAGSITFVDKGKPASYPEKADN